MTWTLEVASNAAASAWTDVTSLVDRKTWKIGGECPGGGQAGTGFGFDFADDVAAYTFPARRAVRFTIGSTVCGRGRVAVKDLARGMIFAGDARQFAVNFTDGNAHLQGIPVHGWVRPAETDVARITALCADFLAGSPRTSTNLATTYLSADGPITLEAKTYDATNPAGVVAEIERIAGKLFFVTVDDEVFYDRVDSANYNAGLSVTDSSPDLSTSFPPIWDGPGGTQDGSELYSGLGGTYGDPPATVYVTDSAVETAHDYWHEIVNLDAATTAQATEELGNIFEIRKVEEQRFRFSIQLTEAQVGLVKYGQNISFRAAAAGVLSPITIRIERLVWEEQAPGIYLAHIENAKLAPRLARGAATRGTAPSAGPTTACIYEPWSGDGSVWTVSFGDPAWITFGTGVLLQTTDNNPGGDNILFRFVDSADRPSLRQSLTIAGSFIADFLPAPNINSGLHWSFGIEWQDTPGGTGGSVQVTFDVAWNDTLSRYETSVGLDSGGGTDDNDLFVGTSTSSVLAIDYSLSLTDSGIGLSVRDLGSTDTLSLAGVSGGAATPVDSTGYVKLTASMSNSDLPEGTVHTLAMGVVDITGPTPAAWCSTGAQAGPQTVPFYLAAISDGSTTAYTTFYPYVEDSLRVLVDGIDWTNSIVQTDPSTGAWAFTLAPATDDIIRVSYVRAA